MFLQWAVPGAAFEPTRYGNSPRDDDIMNNAPVATVAQRGIPPRLRIGVSACLLGEEVRYDGTHKRYGFLVEALGAHCDFVPVCPEVEVGMGTPREPIRLVGDPAAPRLVAPASGIDHTRPMRRFARARVRALACEQLDAFVLKKGSPSCGLFRVRVWPEDQAELGGGGRGGGGTGVRGGIAEGGEAGARAGRGPARAGSRAVRTGRGMFAAALVDGMPLLPVEDEERLDDLAVRASFLARLVGYRRWKDFRAGRPRARALARFHANQRLLLLSHSPGIHRDLDGLVAEASAGNRPMRELLPVYGARYMAALAVSVARRNHATALRRLAVLCKSALDAGDRADLAARIEDFRLGRLPLAAPLILLRHHFRRHPHADATGQTYLDPHPAQLMLGPLL